MTKENWYKEVKKDAKLRKTKLKKRILQKGGGDRVYMEASKVMFIPSTT